VRSVALRIMAGSYLVFDRFIALFHLCFVMEIYRSQ